MHFLKKTATIMMILAAAAFPLKYKGFNYGSWTKNAFLERINTSNLEKLDEIGTDALAVVVTEYQHPKDSTRITDYDSENPGDTTASIKSLETIIDQAQEKDMKILLKPHIDCSGKFRHQIEFKTEGEWKEWFKSYTQFITKYAMLAEQKGIELLSVGCEIDNTTNRPEWEHVIKQIRQVYSGKITYCSFLENADKIPFWNQMDFVGINMYPPIKDLASGKIADSVININSRIKKQILITEWGCPSKKEAHEKPYDWKSQSEPDFDIQNSYYESFFKNLLMIKSKNKKAVAGVFIWTAAPYEDLRGTWYTPLGKPAEKVVKKYFKKF